MFEGLVYDELDSLVEVAYVGQEAFYVVDDDGFRRHVDAEQVDRQVIDFFVEQLRGHEDIAVEQMLRMMGTDDLFAKAAVDAQLRNVSADQIIAQGLPEQARNMLGMMGLKIVINYRGELLRLDQPAAPTGPDDE